MTRTLTIICLIAILAAAVLPVAAYEAERLNATSSTETPTLTPMAWLPAISANPQPTPTPPPVREPMLLNCDTGFEQPPAGCWVETGGEYPQRWCHGNPTIDAPNTEPYAGACMLWQGGYELAADFWDSEPITIPDWASALVVRLAWKVETYEQWPSAYDTCSLWVLDVPDGYPAWSLFNHSNVDAGPWQESTYVLQDAGQWRGHQVSIQFDAYSDETLTTNCLYDDVEVWGRP